MGEALRRVPAAQQKKRRAVGTTCASGALCSTSYVGKLDCSINRLWDGRRGVWPFCEHVKVYQQMYSSTRRHKVCLSSAPRCIFSGKNTLLNSADAQKPALMAPLANAHHVARTRCLANNANDMLHLPVVRARHGPDTRTQTADKRRHRNISHHLLTHTPRRKAPLVWSSPRRRSQM